MEPSQEEQSLCEGNFLWCDTYTIRFEKTSCVMVYKARYCFVNIYYISISCLGSNSAVSMELSEPVGKKISDHINTVIRNSFTLKI